MSDGVVLYGATGYAGRLTAAALAEAGVDPLLAGRDRAALDAGFSEARTAVVTLDDPAGLDRLLAGAAVLVNCAGPFARTQAPLVDACLRTGTAYLDLAGEVPEFLALEARDAEARAAGVMLLPGVGFGCVPTDCLAAHVARRAGRPVRLEIAFKTVGGVSRGTAQTVIGGLHRPGVIRRAGRLEAAAPAAQTRRVDFGDGDGATTVVTNPWRADLVTTGHSTAAADVVAYSTFPAPLRALMRHGGRVGPLLDSRAWQRLVARALRRLPDGPDADALAAGRSACWARAESADGAVAESTLTGPDAYRFTALAAAQCAQLALAGRGHAGYATPATAFDPDFVADILGVTVTDR